MPPESRIAVVDLGTNSTRLLVADVAGEGSLTELERRSEVTRLGDGVDATGRLSDEAVDRVLTCLAGYREIADAANAGRRIAVATSAVRDSSNGDEFQQRVRSEPGFDIRTISGDEEARLTFLGATAGREKGPPTLVVDIGGPGPRPAVAPRNVRRASSSPEMMRMSKPSSERTRWWNSSPLEESRTALVATAILRPALAASESSR